MKKAILIFWLCASCTTQRFTTSVVVNVRQEIGYDVIKCQSKYGTLYFSTPHGMVKKGAIVLNDQLKKNWYLGDSTAKIFINTQNKTFFVQ